MIYNSSVQRLPEEMSERCRWKCYCHDKQSSAGVSGQSLGTISIAWFITASNHSTVTKLVWFLFHIPQLQLRALGLKLQMLRIKGQILPFTRSGKEMGAGISYPGMC